MAEFNPTSPHTGPNSPDQAWEDLRCPSCSASLGGLALIEAAATNMRVEMSGDAGRVMADASARPANSQRATLSLMDRLSWRSRNTRGVRQTGSPGTMSVQIDDRIRARMTPADIEVAEAFYSTSEDTGEHVFRFDVLEDD